MLRGLLLDLINVWTIASSVNKVFFGGYSVEGFLKCLKAHDSLVLKKKGEKVLKRKNKTLKLSTHISIIGPNFSI